MFCSKRNATWNSLYEKKSKLLDWKKPHMSVNVIQAAIKFPPEHLWQGKEVVYKPILQETWWVNRGS